MSKPRADSKLKSMPREWQDQLCEWLTVENVTYQEARKRLIERYEVSSSQAALSEFYSSVAVPWKYARARNLAAEFASMAEGQFRPAILKRVEQLAFEIAASRKVDIKTLRTFVKMLTDSEKVELQRGNLKLAIEKFRQAVKTDLEKGLDALQVELKGNAEALQLFERMKALVLKSVEGAAN
jgi:hypothetical protein